MSRFAAQRVVHYVEEPLPHDTPGLRMAPCPRSGVQVVTPLLPDPQDRAALGALLDVWLAEIGPAMAWYYTPLAFAVTAHRRFEAIAFDVMDELSAFRHAPPDIAECEAALLRAADVVFTGGQSLHDARRGRHANLHCFPSGVDLAHFMAARSLLPEPADQIRLPRPVLGYFGVVDERLDMGLIAGMAALRPDWHFVMLGPVAKLAPEELPQAPNLHWLGPKPYEALPDYLAHWDVALMPFAMNEATRFISPTKAPEYLAGGPAARAGSALGGPARPQPLLAEPVGGGRGAPAARRSGPPPAAPPARGGGGALPPAARPHRDGDGGAGWRCLARGRHRGMRGGNAGRGAAEGRLRLSHDGLPRLGQWPPHPLRADRAAGRSALRPARAAGGAARLGGAGPKPLSRTNYPAGGLTQK